MDPTAPVFAKALRYLSYRPRSEKEIREYLVKKSLQRHPGKRSASRIDSGVVADASPQNDEEYKKIIDVVIIKLKELRFLNDREFAAMWVRSRTEYKPKSKGLIKIELRQKGIAREIIEEVLQSRTEEHSDKALAGKLLEKRKKRYEGMEKQERYQKAGGFLARKGFSYDIIKAAIDEVFEKGV